MTDMRWSSTRDFPCQNNLRSQADRNSGFAMLILLIVITVGILIYYFAFYGTDSGDGTGDAPWREEWRIKGSILLRPVREKLPPADVLDAKPKITEHLFITGYIDENNVRRGEVGIIVASDGKLSGSWHYEFNSEPFDYKVGGGLRGNTDPTKTFKEGREEEPAMLYLIARGSYMKDTVDHKTYAPNFEFGQAYLTGWLLPDFCAFGKIHLRNDAGQIKIYTWTTEK